jgi:predicted nucleic acid-binding protein
LKSALVLDVSACMPWCCEDETTPTSEELLEWAIQGSKLHVPSLWVWEILNVVAVTVRRQRITAGRAKEFLAQLGTMQVRIDMPPSVADFPRLQGLAEHHGLTAYDVAYLDLAIRLSLPLATEDGDLRKAALAEGLEVLGH